MALMLSALTLPCQSCKTVGTEAQKVVVPEIDFPAFPVLVGSVKNENGTVSVPWIYLIRLAEYKIRIEETENTYRDLRAMYQNGETASAPAP